MGALYFYTELYNVIRNHKGVNPRIFAPIRKFVSKIANKRLRKILEYQDCSNIKFKQLDNVIVSVTSFPDRINNIWMTIKTIKLQTYRPEKIILWLSKEQFPEQADIPTSLLNLQDDLFQIQYVDGDLRSHKKYYYALLRYPDKTIITLDDDTFYHPDIIKTLVDDSLRYPDCIIANHAKQITYNEGHIQPYKLWSTDLSSYTYENLVQIGIGGVLYPPHSLHKDVIDVGMFMSVTPRADDLWLNAMARINNTRVMKSHRIFAYLLVNDSAPSLASNNTYNGGNDFQLNSLREILLKKYGYDVYSCSDNIK